MDRHRRAVPRVHGTTIVDWIRHLPLSSPLTRRLLGLTPKGTTPYNRAMHRHIVAHVLGGLVTSILLVVGLVIGVPIALFVGPAGLLAAIPFVMIGMGFWALAWMVSSGLTTGFRLLRHWLVRVSDHLGISGQRPLSSQPPLRRLVHWFGATITVILSAIGIVVGGMGIAMAGTAIGLPAAIPFLLAGLVIWAVLAWLVPQRNESLETPQRTLPPDDSEHP